MKIAVANNIGVQTDTQSMTNNYYLVADNYNFVANNAIEVTNLYTLIFFWQTLNRIDYQNFRAMYSEYVTNTGFSNLDPYSQQMACQHFVVPQATINGVYTVQQQTIYGTNFNNLATACRQQRMSSAMMQVYNRIQKTDIQTIVPVASPLINNYITFGYEGTVNGDPVGIYDYLSSTPGTTYATTGLPSLPITPTDGSNIGQVAADCLNILEGNILTPLT